MGWRGVGGDAVAPAGKKLSFLYFGEDGRGDGIPSPRCPAGALCASRNGVGPFPLVAKTMDELVLTVNFNKTFVLFDFWPPLPCLLLMR